VPVVHWTLKHDLLFYAIFAFALIRPGLGLGLVFTWAIASSLVPAGHSGFGHGVYGMCPFVLFERRIEAWRQRLHQASRD